MKQGDDYPDFAVSLASGVNAAELLEDLPEAVEASGMSVEVSEREPEVWAAMEWMVPAAVMLWFSKEFVGTLLQKAAEDSYPYLKERFLRLIGKSVGPDRIIYYRAFTSQAGKLSPKEGMPHLAIVAPHADGESRIRFVFPTDLSKDLHLSSLDSAIAILAEHYSTYETSLEVGAEDRSPGTIYLRFDMPQSQWLVVDPAEEARRARLARASNIESGNDDLTAEADESD